MCYFVCPMVTFVISCSYTCNPGKQRRWDIIQAHSSVACVLYHTDLDAFLVVGFGRWVAGLGLHTESLVCRAVLGAGFASAALVHPRVEGLVQFLVQGFSVFSVCMCCMQ